MKTAYGTVHRLHCLRCGMVFSSPDKLARHRKRVHGLVRG